MDNFENLLHWSRYLYRTCKIMEIASRELESDNPQSSIFPNEMLLLYLSLLYVTIETFRKFAFRDKRINYLIGKKFEDRLLNLKNLRNSMFHPDDSIYSLRQNEFLAESIKIFPWAYGLTDEFERFLYFYPESINLNAEFADQLRGKIWAGNNWLPKNSIAIIKKKTLAEFETYKLYVKDAFPGHFEEFCKSCNESVEEIKYLPDSYFEDLF